MIFEHDLVVLKKSLGGDYTKRGLILWDEASRGFVINLLEEGQVHPFPQTDAAAPFLNELKVTGQLFG